MVEITEIRVRAVEDGGKLLAHCSMAIDDQFVVHDLRVIDGDRGRFVAMPSRRGKQGEYFDVAHPITSTARSMIQEQVLAAYDQEIAPAAQTG